MSQSELVSKLIRPLSELETTVSPKDVVMAALTWPSQGWVVEALDWLDQGVLIDDEIARSLESVAGRKRYLQSTRHRAFALAKRWRRAQACEGQALPGSDETANDARFPFVPDDGCRMHDALLTVPLLPPKSEQSTAHQMP